MQPDRLDEFGGLALRHLQIPRKLALVDDCLWPRADFEQIAVIEPKPVRLCLGPDHHFRPGAVVDDEAALWRLRSFPSGHRIHRAV